MILVVQQLFVQLEGRIPATVESISPLRGVFRLHCVRGNEDAYRSFIEVFVTRKSLSGI